MRVLHPVHWGTDAELLLADGGAEKSGKYLVRQKGAADTDYILSVIYKGAASHHALTRDAPGDEFSINKAPTGYTSIPEVRGCTL